MKRQRLLSLAYLVVHLVVLKDDPISYCNMVTATASTDFCCFSRFLYSVRRKLSKDWKLYN